MLHIKKIWPEYFDAIKARKKNFEVRLGDFKCKEGDILLLKEWNPKTEEFTGRSIKKKVSYVLNTKKIRFWSKNDINKHGFVILSLK